MKKRYVPIITFTVAILLVGSIAYAADKRKKTKTATDSFNEIPEDETLQVELLAAVEDHRHTRPGAKPVRKEECVDDLSLALGNDQIKQ